MDEKSRTGGFDQRFPNKRDMSSGWLALRCLTKPSSSAMPLPSKRATFAGF